MAVVFLIVPQGAVVTGRTGNAGEAADWMLAAARTRPVRIAPRKALTTQVLGIVAPGQLNAMMRRQTVWPDPEH